MKQKQHLLCRTGRIVTLALAFALGVGITGASAQTQQAPGLSLRTNLLLWAFGSPHLGIDLSFGSRWQAGIDGSYGNWHLSHTAHAVRLSTAGAQVRRYFRPFGQQHIRGGSYSNSSGSHSNPSGYRSPSRGCYLGLDLRYTHFNEQLFSTRLGREGDLLTAGLLVGYSFCLDPRGHWAVDTALGLGYIHKDYDRYAWYAPARMNRHVDTRTANAFGLTTLEAALVYRF